MVSVSLVFFEENIFLVNQIIQHLYIIILYWKQKQKKKKQKKKKKKTKAKTKTKREEVKKQANPCSGRNG